MAIINNIVNLDVGATPILAAAADRGRRYLCFTNHSGGDVWLGGSLVSDSNGIVLAHTENFVVQQQHENDHAAAQEWYGYDVNGTATLHVTLITEDSTT